MRYILDKILAYWYPKASVPEHKPHMVITPKGHKVNIGGCILKKRDDENHKDSGSTRYH